MTRLDRVLLKGFYTNSRDELENQRIIAQKVEVNEFDELVADGV